MSKTKKTRAQKIRATMRQHNYHIEFVTPKTANKETVDMSQIPQAHGLTTVSFLYVRHDLVKTVSLTFVILLIQLTLFFLLRNHSLPFLGIRY